MKKILFVLLLSSNLFSIDLGYKDKINNIRDKKIIELGEFSRVNPSINFATDFKSGSISGGVSYGPFSYSRSNSQSTISLSQDINKLITEDFRIQNLTMKIKKYSVIDEYLKEYNEILNIYSNIIVNNKQIENIELLKEELNTSLRILDVQYNEGKISEIEYELIKYKLYSKELELKSLYNNLQENYNKLEEYGLKYTGEQFELKELDMDKLNQFILSENEKMESVFMLNKLINKQGELNEILPTMNVSASYTLETKQPSVSFSLSKSFDMNKIEKKDVLKKQYKKLDVSDELKNYEILKEKYKLALYKEELSKKELEINVLKYKYGKISYKTLLDKKIEYFNSTEQTLKAKNDLSIYIILKEI